MVDANDNEDEIGDTDDETGGDDATTSSKHSVALSLTACSMARHFRLAPARYQL